MSDPIPPPGNDVALQNVALAFSELIPSPTEDQARALARLLGFADDTYEADLKRLLASVLEQDDEVEIDLDAEEDNPLDTFLLAFYIVQPEPTEEQLATLAALVGLTLEELEAETYRVINSLTADLDSDFVADDDDDEDLLTDGDAVIQLI